MAIIRITDLTLRTIIGTNDWEREQKQKIVINVTIEFDPRRAARSDRLKDTVDYKAITKKIITCVLKSRYQLLEKLTAQVLRLVMAADRRVLWARVRIDKPLALRYAKSVSVELEQKRGGRASRRS